MATTPADPIDIFKEEGNEHFKNKRYQEAVDAYSRAIELNPEHHICYSNRSAAYNGLKQNDLALQDADKCIEIQRDWAKGWHRRGRALFDMKRYEESVRACEEGLPFATDTAKDNLTSLLENSKRSVFCDQLKGKWHGTVSETIGGYVQEFEFVDQKNIRVKVMGKCFPGLFQVNAGEEPYHMDITVIPPDAPPGFIPPPVPYIVRLKGDANAPDRTLDLCCPYMSTARPTSFDGPGYSEMHPGVEECKPDETIAKLSREERRLACVKETLTQMPDTEMPNINQADSEEQNAAKILAHMKFQSTVYKLETKFGEDIFKEVITHAHGNERLPGDYGKLVTELHEKMRKTGLMDAPSMEEPTPSTEKSREIKPEPVKKEKRASSEDLEHDSDSSGIGLPVLAIGAAVAIGIAAIVVMRLKKK